MKYRPWSSVFHVLPYLLSRVLGRLSPNTPVLWLTLYTLCSSSKPWLKLFILPEDHFPTSIAKHSGTGEPLKSPQMSFRSLFQMLYHQNWSFPPPLLKWRGTYRGTEKLSNLPQVIHMSLVSELEWETNYFLKKKWKCRSRVGKRRSWSNTGTENRICEASSVTVYSFLCPGKGNPWAWGLVSLGVCIPYCVC